MDVSEAFGDVGIPDAMAAPGPAARVFGGCRSLVLIEPREIHSPDVTVLWW